MDAGPTDQEDELVVAPVPEAPAGGQRRGRIAFAAALVVGAVALPATLLLIGRDTPPDEVTAAVPDEATTTSTEKVERSSTTSIPPTTDTTPTTAPAVVTTVPAAPPTTVPRRRPSTPTTVQTTTTAPPLVCRNSTDPACGPFYWDPAPVNQPITASFVNMPAQLTWPHSEVDIRVHMSDPDSYFIWSSVSVNGALVGGTARVRNCDWVRPRYGPWTPERPIPTQPGIYFINPVYLTEPGTYLVELSLGTGTCGDAYASDTLLTTTIEVVEPPPEG